jgi:large subunit ribosomal protein L25
MACLKATKREVKGSRGCRATRSLLKVPAVLYGKGIGSHELALELNEVESYFRNVKERFCELDFAGKRYNVELKEVQRHPITREVMHLDFFVAQS